MAIADTHMHVGGMHASKARAIRGDAVGIIVLHCPARSSEGRHGCTLLRDNDGECLRC